MPGIFQSLDIARRAIWASRLGMDVTSHNIANVNTPGYSRQRVNFRAAPPLQLPQGQLGLGVSTGDIERVRSRLVDSQFRQTAFSLGNATVKESLYTQLEAVIQEPSENSIGSLMTEFFSGFSSLAADPENTTIRDTIRQKATALVDTFHNKTEQLNSMKSSVSQEVTAAVDEINGMLEQIATLNGQISSAEAGSGTANDLRDRRDMLLDRLSEYMKISYSETGQGSVNVSAEGISLVGGTRANKLTVQTQSDGNRLKILVSGPTGNGRELRYGRLGGLLEMYNHVLPDIQEHLDTLAGTLATEVNRLHAAGKGLAQGDPPTASSNINFFAGNSAATLQVDPEIMDNLANIAASSDGTPGNGDVATAIANMRNEKLFNGRTQTLDDYYTNMVHNLGVEIDRAQSTRNSQELMRDQLQNQREAASGVSLDEEMTNLIKYQRSFEAAAKVVKAVDDIMQTVINMV